MPTITTTTTTTRQEASAEHEGEISFVRDSRSSLGVLPTSTRHVHLIDGEKDETVKIRLLQKILVLYLLENQKEYGKA